MIDSQKPRDAQDWLDALQHFGIGDDYDESLAAVIRIAAGQNPDAVCMCSGVAALPYANWILDGMAMTGRLIIHVDPAHSELDSIVQQQLDKDIRAASHYQEISSFCTDIASHRLDLLVIEMNDRICEYSAQLLSLLNDNALMVVMAKDAVRELVHKNHSADYFFAQLGANQQAMVLARKGAQHRVTRRAAQRKR